MVLHRLGQQHLAAGQPGERIAGRHGQLVQHGGAQHNRIQRLGDACQHLFFQVAIQILLAGLADDQALRPRQAGLHRPVVDQGQPGGPAGQVGDQRGPRGTVRGQLQQIGVGAGDFRGQQGQVMLGQADHLVLLAQPGQRQVPPQVAPGGVSTSTTPAGRWRINKLSAVLSAGVAAT